MDRKSKNTRCIGRVGRIQAAINPLKIRTNAHTACYREPPVKNTQKELQKDAVQVERRIMQKAIHVRGITRP